MAGKRQSATFETAALKAQWALALELVHLTLQHPECERWVGGHPLAPTGDSELSLAVVRRARDLAWEVVATLPPESKTTNERRTLALALVLDTLRSPDGQRWVPVHPLSTSADDRLGIALARRAWAMAQEILDTRPELDIE